MRPVPSVLLPVLGAALLALTLMARHSTLATLAAGAVYGLALHHIRRQTTPPWIVPLILAVGLAARLIAFSAHPVNSNDIYRYVWDGRVQAAGINPYRYLPTDPTLAFLRDAEPGPALNPEAIFPNINHATAISPPAAQAIFLLVGLTAPNIWTMKAVMLAFDLLTTALALLMLRAAGRPAAHVLVWAWNPLIIWEFANAGHIDAVSTAFSALTLYAAIRSRPILTGIALAGAVLSKFLPASLFPAVWQPRTPRGWEWRTPLAAVLTILAAYACYASAGSAMLGLLSGYTEEQGFETGEAFLLLRLLRLAVPLPEWAGQAYQLAAILILDMLALWAIRQPLPASPPARAQAIATKALLLSATLLALLSPHDPWYLTALVVPAILVPAWSALWPTLAAPLLYLGKDPNHLINLCMVYLPAFPLLILDVRSRLFRHR